MSTAPESAKTIREAVESFVTKVTSPEFQFSWISVTVACETFVEAVQAARAAEANRLSKTNEMSEAA